MLCLQLPQSVDRPTETRNVYHEPVVRQWVTPSARLVSKTLDKLSVKFQLSVTAVMTDFDPRRKIELTQVQTSMKL